MGRASSRKREQREARDLSQARDPLARGRPPSPTAAATAVPSFSIAAEAYSGPIPPPALLERFNEIIPDGANRLMLMAERQEAHRIAIEGSVIRHDLQQSRLGLYFGGAVGTGVLALAAYMTFVGAAPEGAKIVVVSLAGIVSTFLYATSSRKGERTGRWKQLADLFKGQSH